MFVSVIELSDRGRQNLDQVSGRVQFGIFDANYF